VRVPRVALINISDLFVLTTAEHLRQRGLSLSPGVAVGTVYLSGLAPVTRRPALRDDDIEVAARIYCLDMGLQNPDRRSTNPNCAYDAGTLVAFDFENAFSFRFMVGNRPDPWDVTQFGFHEQHLFHAALRSRGAGVRWKQLVADFGRADEPWLTESYGTIPPAWLDTAEQIVSHVRILGDHLAEFERELGRSVL
jgi:hypothetical protein